MEAFFETYLQYFIPFAAVLLAFFLGKSAYYRQKEYELITERYLKQGLDRASEQVEKSLGIFRHNLARALTVLKLFRDAGKDIPQNFHRTGFIEPDPSTFEIWVDYRIKDLIGNDIFNHSRQLLEAFVQTSYSFFTTDLCTLIRIYSEGGKELQVKADRSVIVSEYMKKLEELNHDASRFYVLLSELQTLADVLQTQRFSFKALKHFKYSDAAKNSIEVLNSLFPEEKESDLD